MDTGIVEGSTISMFYDPMISKVKNSGCKESVPGL